jgi:hypothetical protein
VRDDAGSWVKHTGRRKMGDGRRITGNGRKMGDASGDARMPPHLITIKTHRLRTFKHNPKSAKLNSLGRFTALPRSTNLPVKRFHFSLRVKSVKLIK